MRKKRIYMTTTNSIENGKVVENKGIVSSHLVAGTGFLTDFIAGLSDIFGGRSGVYKEQLESLYIDAMCDLSNNAVRIGANALIGVKIDVDNISGKGMSMFMITAMGTAVVAEFDAEQLANDISDDSVNWDMITYEMGRRRVLNELAGDDVTITKKSWEFILNNPSPEYAQSLVNRYASIGGSTQYEVSCENFESYISKIDRETAIKYLYPILIDSTYHFYNEIFNILKENNLFDAPSILGLLKNKAIGGSIFKLLTLHQPSYTNADLSTMKELLEEIDNLPNVGIIEEGSGGLIKGKDKYVCRHGHRNSADSEYCLTCGENIKGQKEEDVQAIEAFRTLCETLETLLKSE